MNQQNKIYKIDTDLKTITKLQGNTYVAFDSGSQVDYVYAPFVSSDVVYVRYVPEKYYTAINVVPIPLGYMTLIGDTETVDEIMADQVQIAGYSLWKRTVYSDVTGINDTYATMGLRVSFIQTQLQAPDEYLGYETYTGLTDAQIITELASDYPAAAEDDFVNVLSLPADEYFSWTYTTAAFVKGTTVTNATFANETDYHAGTIKPSGTGNRETTHRDITDDLTDAVSGVEADVAAIIGVSGGYMLTVDYDTVSDNNSVTRALTLDNTGVGGSVTISAATQAIHNDYTNQSVKIGSNPSFNSITATTKVNTAEVDFGTREITDNATDETLDVKLNANVTLQLGQEQHLHAINKTGITITEGQVVYLKGASGNKPEIALASNTTKTTAHNTLGMATEAIANNTWFKATIIPNIHCFQ